ncbi:MAG: HD domain-containing protein [Lachnospiraceae bacterium]|nr:HD domain-containing protein [Lachnospiraceae bacterium]
MDHRISKHGKDILKSKNYNKMHGYIQHGSVSVFRHCVRVAETSLKIERFLKKRFNVKMDERALVRGALLHDYFLYDWHNKKDRPKGLHGFTHPGTALKNAIRDYAVSEREKKIIRQHMFPLTITKIPTCKEAWVVNIADKWCSLAETAKMRKKRH